MGRFAGRFGSGGATGKTGGATANCTGACALFDVGSAQLPTKSSLAKKVVFASEGTAVSFGGAVTAAIAGGVEADDFLSAPSFEFRGVLLLAGRLDVGGAITGEGGGGIAPSGRRVAVTGAGGGGATPTVPGFEDLVHSAIFFAFFCNLG